MDEPETRYARSGEVNITYQVTGDGPFDVVYLTPIASRARSPVARPVSRARARPGRRRVLRRVRRPGAPEIRCACAITEGSGSSAFGLEVRAGVHAGECEIVDGKMGGIAVHIGARVRRTPPWVRSSSRAR